MRLKRWFFRAGVVLGAVAAYRIVTRRPPQLAKAPAISTTSRQPYPPLATNAATQSMTDTTQTQTTTAPEPDTSMPVIGNIHKMVYHQQNDRHLPIEENRVYFDSEQEAIDAGYRKAETLA